MRTIEEGEHRLVAIREVSTVAGINAHVPARSLWIMTGEARTKWLHGIAARLTDLIDGERRNRRRRVSITFRTAKDAALVRSNNKT